MRALAQNATIFVLTSLAMGAVAHSGVREANAAWTRHTPSLCTVPNALLFDDGFEFTGAGNALSEDISATFLVCPINETDTFTKVDVATVDVYVFDGDNDQSASAQACWADFGGTTASCTAAVTSGTTAVDTGHFTLTINTNTVWTSTFGAGYLYVKIPELDGSVQSYLEGFRTST